MELIIDIAMYLACVVTGILIGRFLWKPKYDGTLKIDRTDELKDKYSLDFQTDLDRVPNKRFVIFEVVVIDSHKNSVL